MGGNVNTTYKYGDEEFQIDRTDRLSIVVKDKENIVTIKVDRTENYDVRREDGWGAWHTSLDEALQHACRLLVGARTQLSKDQRVGEIDKLFNEVFSKERR